MFKAIKHSWHFVKPMQECQHLLQETMSQYNAHFYRCLCGYEETIVLPEFKTHSYQCPRCGNEEFIYGFNAIDRDNVIKNESTALEYECQQVEGGFEVVAYVNVPIDADYIRQRIVFAKKRLYYWYIDHDGLEKHNLDTVSDHICSTMGKMLKQVIIDTFRNSHTVLHQRRSWLVDKGKINEMLFHMANPQLVDTCFFHWKKYKELRGLATPVLIPNIEQALLYLISYRKERSIRRVVFEQYEKWSQRCVLIEHLHDIRHLIPYDPAQIFIISRCFDDPNIVVRLLEKDLGLMFSEMSDAEYEMKDMIWLVKFLKKFYSEKQIAALLLTIEGFTGPWYDLLRLVPRYKNAIRKYFQKVKLTVDNLHDEIINSSQYFENKLLNNVEFSYEQDYEFACCIESGLNFQLPRSSEILRGWAHLLQNCLEGYAISIKKRKTTVYGVFKEDQLCYAVEVSEGEIIQMSGRYNDEIPEYERQVILEWKKRYLEHLSVDTLCP